MFKWLGMTSPGVTWDTGLDNFVEKTKAVVPDTKTVEVKYEAYVSRSFLSAKLYAEAVRTTEMGLMNGLVADSRIRMANVSCLPM